MAGSKPSVLDWRANERTALLGAVNVQTLVPPGGTLPPEGVFRGNVLCACTGRASKRNRARNRVIFSL